MPRAELESVARRMVEALRHRGPNDDGVWADPGSGIALSHRRLSILDLSSAGHQPMHSASDRFVIVYNGETYNFRHLARELSGHGHKFKGHSDTEVILAAFEQWGLETALKGFVGMFAFALWDRQEQALHLARDRIGEKPLYYGWNKGVFLFGSELKALRAHPHWSGDIDRDALVLFLQYGYIPEPRSIYKGIRKLTPGTVLTVRPGHTKTGALPEPARYWSLREIAVAGAAMPFAGSETEATESLDVLIRQAVAGQMVADVPVGAFLSGGMDSSTVVAIMQAQSARPVKTFTIGFHEDRYNEAKYAKAVARHLGTDHTELHVTPAEAMAVIPSLPTIYDEPFADGSQIPTFLVSRLARSAVTVTLSGDGGDELFGGYTRYFQADAIQRRVGWIPRSIRRLVSHGLRSVPQERWDAMLGWVVKGRPDSLWHERVGERIHGLAKILSRSSDEIYQNLLSHWKQPEDVVLGSPDRPKIGNGLEARAELPTFWQRMMLSDAVGYLPGDILVKLDRASMAVSLESRVPLLDHRLVEFAFRVPLSLKVREGQGKWLLRQVLAKYVPRDLVERPKKGFSVPIEVWLRGPLRDWAEALISSHRLQQEGFFQPAPIRGKWEEHLSGKRSWYYHLWNVLMFQAWLNR